MANTLTKFKDSKLYEKLKKYITIGKISKQELDAIISNKSHHNFFKDVVSSPQVLPKSHLGLLIAV